MTSLHTTTSHAPRKSYQSLALHKAADFGWAEHHSLTMREYTVLSFVADQGTRNESGMAFAWFPLGGQEWWAAMLGMNAPALRKTLERLRTKGLIVNLDSARFVKSKGVGIPTSVLDECIQWHADRQRMIYMEAPDCPSECDPQSQVCDPQSHPCDPQSHRTSHSPSAVRDSRSINKDKARERATSLTAACSPTGCSPEETPGGSVRDQGDGWDQPKDERDDFATPRDVREKPAPYHRPSTRVYDAFHAAWLVSRQKRTGLALDCSVKAVFFRNINLLLVDFTEDDLLAMVGVFFRQIDNGMLMPKAEELWRDFLWNKATLYRLMKQRTPSTSDLTAMAAESNRRQEAFR